jgi:integrase
MAGRTEGLTAAGVKHAGPGVYGDGGGLYLRVKPDGRASWTLRYQIAGVRRDLGLGRARGPGAVSLADARGKAAEARRLLAAGRDPLAVREADEAARRDVEAVRARQARSSFRDVAAACIAAREPEWRNAKHAAQWGATLATYAHPVIGDTAVDTLSVPDVLRVLQPIWTTKPETAARVRGRIEAVLSYAAATGLRPRGFNPASWRGNLDAILPAAAKVKRRVREANGQAEHHAALPWRQLPAFMRALAARDGAAALALRFAILTAARTGEVVGAGWREMDIDGAVWTVPAGRMKGEREHRVPLSPAALDVLREVAERTGGCQGAVFQAVGKPLSNMALLMALRRMNATRPGEPARWADADGRPVTPHGFRSAFRDWAGDCTNAPREVTEAALAHTVGNKVELAYRRGDALDKRRALMDAWAEWCAGRGEVAENVVPQDVSLAAT